MNLISFQEVVYTDNFYRNQKMLAAVHIDPEQIESISDGPYETVGIEGSHYTTIIRTKTGVNHKVIGHSKEIVLKLRKGR